MRLGGNPTKRNQNESVIQQPLKMRHPIQCLHCCPSTNRLFAAVGGAIQVFHSATGMPIAEWTAPQLPAMAPSKKSLNKASKKERDGTVLAENGMEESPSKKHKTDEKAEPIRTSNLGVGAPRGEGEGGKNSVTKILSARNGGYLVVVTNEDKTLRVLEVAVDGGLKVLSERPMPKRPCAISMTDSDSTILLADKFGDVYAMPLLEEVVQPKPKNPTAAQLAKEERERLAEVKRKRTEISHELPFTAQLLLGHVSMLVDVLAVTIPDEEGKEITYVITADRDEHIRVSRYPQCFVIEGFCLGHEAFISTLLTPSWDKTQLISGGGDTFLLRWDWRNRAVLEKVDVTDLVRDVVGGKVGGGKHDHGEAERSGGEKEFKITVVGMWEVPKLRMLILAFESVPAIYVFVLGSSLTHNTTLPLSGHPLDVAVDTSNNTFYVSVVPASEGAPMIEKFTHTTDQWKNVTEGDDAVRNMVEKTGGAQLVGDEKMMNEGLLYATGLLRKGTARAEKEE